jgi:hypothetical protein
MAYKRISPQPIVEGGTGVQSNTAYAVLCGGTSGTSPIQSIAGVGSSGQLLTSNGAGALPTFQSPSGTGFVQTLTGSTSGGAISPSAGNININAGTGITVVGTTNTLTISATGGGSGITSITGTTGGSQTGPAITLSGGTTGLSFGGSANTITTAFAGITANGGTVSLATDATTSSVNIGTGAGAKTVVLGSTNTTSSTTIHSGNGGINITNTNQPITITSGTATIAIANDATANTVNIGTGAGAKTVVVGSTNTTSGLTLNSGSTGITATGVFGATSSSSVPLFINSSGKLGTSGGSGGSTFVQTLTGSTSGGAISPTAGNINLVAGTGITVTGSGSSLTITNTGSSGSSEAFFAALDLTQNNVTGNNITYIVPYADVVYDLGGNFNTGGPTGAYTAPVNGIYNFSVGVTFGTLTSTNATGGNIYLHTTTFGDLLISSLNLSAARAANSVGSVVINQVTMCGNVYVQLQAGDLVYIQALACGNGTAQTVSVIGSTAPYLTYFSGALVG